MDLTVLSEKCVQKSNQIRIIRSLKLFYITENHVTEALLLLCSFEAPYPKNQRSQKYKIGMIWRRPFIVLVSIQHAQVCLKLSFQTELQCVTTLTAHLVLRVCSCSLSVMATTATTP